jgi:hypothetical protein
LQLARILDQDDPLVLLRDLRKQRVGERRFAGASTTGHQDILTVDDRLPQGAGLHVGHDPV